MDPAERDANGAQLRLRISWPCDAESRIGFLGTYPPRRCGIATFTRDLADGMQSAERARQGAGGRRHRAGRAATSIREAVEYEIQQGTKGDYARAAELVNYKDVRWVSVQHEYGIFGGDDGAYVLDFLGALRVPAVVTLHTVLQNPSPSQRAIVQKMADSGARLVVMSGVAADLLAQRYDLRGASGPHHSARDPRHGAARSGPS